ncbi:MAG: BON domain-containing protein, partial [Bryobacteraceae bacterium]
MRILVLLFLGLALQPSAPAASRATAKAPANQPALSDAQIDAAIKTKLAKSKIGQDGFKFRVQGGIVYWDGSTDVIQHKGAATRMARTAGARSVVNNIKISEAGRRGADRSAERRRA